MYIRKNIVIKAIMPAPAGMTITDACHKKFEKRPVVALVVIAGEGDDGDDAVEPLYLHEEGFLATGGCTGSNEFLWDASMGTEAERIEYAQYLHEQWKAELDERRTNLKGKP